MEAPGNITLTYPVKIYMERYMETVLFADSIEFFVDEHGIQWAKFKAKNGPDTHKQHILRTENIVVVVDA